MVCVLRGCLEGGCLFRCNLCLRLVILLLSLSLLLLLLFLILLLLVALALFLLLQFNRVFIRVDLLANTMIQNFGASDLAGSNKYGLNDTAELAGSRRMV